MSARAAFLVVAIALAACGGGGSPSGPPTAPPGTPSPTPTPTATTTPATGPTAIVSITLPSGGGALAMPAVSGYSGTISLPAVSAGAGSSMQIVTQAGSPGGLPVIQTRRRTLMQSNEGQLFLTFTFAANVTMSGTPGFSIAGPLPSTNGTFFLWLYDPTKSQLGWQVIGGPNPGALPTTFAPGSSTQSFTAGVGYVFALVFASFPATPTPAPTPTPTSSPASVPALTTTSYNFPSSPGDCANPNEITVGPDGNLWVSTGPCTINGYGCITKFTTAGVGTCHALSGSPTRYPVGITAGPDNALWFTENTGNLIGRSDTSGNITEYSAANTGGPIVLGSDDNLWFAIGNQIDGFSPTSHAVIGTTTLPPGATVTQLISDPANGALLAAATNSNVGYIYAFAPGTAPTQIYSNAGVSALAVGVSNIFALVSTSSGNAEIVAFSQTGYGQSTIPLPTSFTFQGSPYPTAFSSPLVVMTNGNFFMANGCDSYICRLQGSNAPFYDAAQVTSSGVVVGQGAGWPRLQEDENVQFTGATIGPDGNAWFVLDIVGPGGYTGGSLERVTPNAH